ncbi:MAG: NAD-dependent epimerase/dehydratase family protein [Gammaproteobacteria bacterium]
MLSGEKILITGPAGGIAFGVARALARENEVWGIARFGDPAQRAEVEALGVKTRAVDLATCEFGDLPRDFTYLLHIAVAYDPDNYDRAIQVNAEGTGFLMDHCRRVKAALVMSTLSVYRPHPDPWYAFRETDPLGDIWATFSAPYSVSKIAEEAVARYCARSLNIPTTIARMGSAYWERGGMPAGHLHAIAAGQPVQVRWDPIPYSPIHNEDIVDQVEALLDAASVPATIVNWAGDEPVSVQQWSAYLGELLGVQPTIQVTPVLHASLGSVGDHRKRRAITGPCKVQWKDGFRRMAQALYPQQRRER